MFWNIYTKRILATLRDKAMLIWTLIFPIMMATLFYFTMSSLDTASALSVIPMAVVDNDALTEDGFFKQVLTTVSTPGENQLFELIYTGSSEEASALLQEGSVSCYLVPDSTPHLYVAGKGIQQTIAQSFLNQYLQKRSTIETLLTDTPGDYTQIAALFHTQNYTTEISLGATKASSSVHYFYALLAMTCMYAAFQGISSVLRLQPNLSSLGARRSISPIGHFIHLFYDLLGGFTLQTVASAILLTYMIAILKVDFGDNLLLVAVTKMIGDLAGFGFGILIGSLSKLKENAKTAILISISMVCTFLSGLMMPEINYIIKARFPVIAWINPAARITDAFYSLYYYTGKDQFFINITILLIMTGIMFGLTAILTRRKHYESI